MFANTALTGAELSALTPILGIFEVATSCGTIVQRRWSCSDTPQRNKGLLMGGDHCHVMKGTFY